MEFTSVSPDLIRGKVDTMILKCLQDRDLYGLEICNLIQDASGGTYILKKPTLYSALRRLEGKKFVKGYDVLTYGIKRRYYKLTELGKNSFAHKKEDWRYSKDVVDNLLYDQIDRYRFRAGHGIEGEGSLGTTLHNIEKAEEDIQGAQSRARGLGLETSTLAAIALEEFVSTIKKEEDEKEEQASIQQVSTGDYAVTTSGTGTNVIQYFIQGDYISGSANFNKTSLPPASMNKGFSLPLVSSQGNESVEVLPFILAQTQTEIEKEYPKKEPFPELNTQPPPIMMESYFQPQPNPVRQSTPDLESYVTPSEYIVWTPQTPIKPIPNYAEVISEPANESENVHIKPFTRHYSEEKRGVFVLYNRLRLGSSALASALLVLFLVASWISLKTIYTTAEQAMFTLSYVAIGVYFFVYLAVFIAYPMQKRLSGNYNKELLIRTAISFSLTILIVGANIITGFGSRDLTENIVFLIVPATLASVFLLEGISIYALKKAKLFSAE